MKIRNNRALKVIALFLLLFELMAPAYLAAGTSDYEKNARGVNVPPFQAPFCSLLIEELCENEGKEETGDFFQVATYEFYSNNTLRIKQANPASFVASLRQFETHPPLFQLLRTLII